MLSNMDKVQLTNHICRGMNLVTSSNALISGAIIDGDRVSK